MKLPIKPIYALLSVSIIFVLLLTSCAQSGPVDATEEIRQANEAFIAAFNANDAAELAMVYTEDGTIDPPNAESISGREGIEAFWQAGFEAGIASGVLTTVKATAMGDIAVENGTFEINSADGTMIDKGKYVVIWKKVDGVWKYHRDIWNSSMPLPEPAPAPQAEEAMEE